jgi:Zn-dependent metalloprotease
VENLADSLETSVEQLFKLQIKILTKNDLDDVSFFFNNSTFTWKKGKTVKIIYGSVDLEERDNLKNDMLLCSAANITKLKEQIENQTTKLADFNIKHQLFQNEYEQLLEREQNLEFELYSKFAVVLNAKKQKICELKSLLYEKDELCSDSFSDPTNMKRLLPTSSMETDSDSPVLQAIPKRRKLIVDTTQPERISIPVASSSKEPENPYEVDTQELFDRI